MDATRPSGRPASRQGSALRRGLALAVHGFTASGAVFGVIALLAIMRGDLAWATIYMLVALGIDSMDGAFARLVGVSEHAPEIDGRRMDDIVDYLNFVIVPAVFMVRAGSVLAPGWVALAVLASAFGFSRVDAKTEDDFFLGWPSYWNVLAIYLWLLDLTPFAGTLWVVGCAIAIFVPWKYVYPSRLPNLFLRYLTSYSGVVWAVAVGFAALQPELAGHYHVAELSLAYPIFYVGLSLWFWGLERRLGEAQQR
ncbi:MAG: CDP-diacylglycerol O-phosphatidyltransferase [Deltaproteobacteria bacterium]|nr:CDP-diacylglycerol O-phosphatidyltransferase [Deltaproteobacteria bacterium]